MPPDGSFPFSLPTTAVGTTTLAPVRPSSGPPNAGVVVGPLKQMSGMSVRSETSFIRYNYNNLQDARDFNFPMTKFLAN